MASDDETIRIQVDSVEARAQLAALEKEVRELEAELKTLNSTAGVTNAEIEGTTRRLEEAKAKFAEAGEQVQKFNDTQEEGGKKTQSLADKYVTLGLKVFGARQVLMAAGEAMRSVAQATGSYSGATKDAIDQTDNLLQSIASLDLIGASKALGQLAGQTVAWAEGLNEVNVELGNLADKNAADEFRKILKAQGDLVQGHEKETAALNLKAEALSREIATQRQSGEIQKWLRDEIEATVKAYEKAGEAVPAPLAAQVTALGITTDAQDKAAASAEKLEAAGVKSAEARAKAEVKAAEEVVASLEKQRAALDDAVKKADDALAAAQKNTDAAEAAQFGAPGGVPSGEGDPRLAEMEKLRLTMAELNAIPAQTPEQVVQLAAAQDSYAKLNAQLTKFNFGLGESGTLMGQASAADAELNAQRDRAIALYERQQSLQDEALNRLEQEEGGYGRLSDAMQEFVDVGLKAGDNMAGTFSDAGKSASETGDAVEFLAETADEAAGSLEDVADAAGSIGDEAKKGTDKAKEGLAGMVEGLEEAIPLAEQLKGILQEIVTLGSQADI